jgi:hypothetical protein
MTAVAKRAAAILIPICGETLAQSAAVGCFWQGIESD